MTSPATYDPSAAVLQQADGTLPVRSGPRRRCPACQQLGQRSQVTANCVMVTLKVGYSYWDEDGRLHQHDPNVTTTDYACTEGHAWQERERGRCWCGWGRDTATPEARGR